MPQTLEADKTVQLGDVKAQKIMLLLVSRLTLISFPRRQHDGSYTIVSVEVDCGGERFLICLLLLNNSQINRRKCVQFKD